MTPLPYPALHVSHGGIWIATADGTRSIGRGEAVRIAADTPVILLNAPLTAQRLGYPDLSGLDLLELFAFLRPARFMVPTHYFKAEEHEGRVKYASTDPRQRDRRASVLGRMLFNWVAHQGPASVLNIEKKAFDNQPGPITRLDIVLVVQGDNHLVGGANFHGQNVTVERTEIENPRLLGFECHRVMAERAGDYDLFCFSEDDLLSHDPLFFPKVVAFQQAFGPMRTLMPNRYEINQQGPSFKTYVDGPVRARVVAPFHAAVPDAETLDGSALLGDPLFERATNPHSGFFAITAEQLAYWRTKPWFLNRDTNFIGPLESAATLGMLQTFAIYKSAKRSLGWLQIEHLDHKFSIHEFPKVDP